VDQEELELQEYQFVKVQDLEVHHQYFQQLQVQVEEAVVIEWVDVLLNQEDQVVVVEDVLV
jgi:hypothetical protein